MIKKWFGILKSTVNEFGRDNGMKLSASLAYYTIFSIGPMLLLIISLTGLFFEKRDITQDVYSQIRSLIGQDGAQELLSIIRNMQQQNSAAKYGIISIVILFFGASGVFVEIQTSINYIWSLKAKPTRGWLKFLQDRLLSFSLIAGIGFLLIVSLFVNTLMDLLSQQLQRLFSIENVLLFKALNLIILFGIITLLFAVIYKVLPDAKIAWKDAFVGASFTGILFLLGKFLIGFYLGNSKFGNTYGAAAALILILSWIYYSAIILYMGAEFTKVYALRVGKGIRPYKTAVFIMKKEEKEITDPNAYLND
ncbi:YihY/virulence factor BrkB family protein [Taibaiella soli]|uniref:Ribonuclease BN n=1 Tax=Taibaiella soli TaxID=1649169 RepID=A0A2W2ABZ2_9BACT|nr:YihY/virulence factor BrkB family protein [Taibaiella soli]PZF72935.1 ribonuclease BN [Taibaiella soli]